METTKLKLLKQKIHSDKKSLIIYIFIFELIISILFISLLRNIGPSQHSIPGTDYLYYYKPTAESILNGNGIPIQNGIGIRYPIGYPIFLSIIFFIAKILRTEGINLIIISNILITSLSACILFLIIDTITTRKISIIATVLWSTYPFNLWFIKNPNTEVPFIAMFFLAILTYIISMRKASYKYIFISGILFGISSLIRPISILLPFLLLFLSYFIYRKPKILSILIIIGYSIIITPWIGYIYLKTGKIVPLSTGGGPSISYGMLLMLSVGEEGDKLDLPHNVKNLIKKVYKIDKTKISPVISFLAKESIRNPVAFINLIRIKLARSWYATSEMWWEKTIMLIQLFYLIPAIFGIYFFTKNIKSNKKDLILLISVIFYFWSITTLALSILRYMVPVMAFVMVFSSFTLYKLFNKFNNYVIKKYS